MRNNPESRFAHDNTRRCDYIGAGRCKRVIGDGDCLFCKIINGDIPTEFLFKDERIVVFRDINPEAPVHLLIVPVKHIRSVNDLKDEDQSIIACMMMTAKEMAKKEGIAASGYKLFINVEKGGGQFIFHLHMHLIGGWE